jgi:hypothetical protein
MHIRVACNKSVLQCVVGYQVAYLEAFAVQYAFTPRGRCSDMGVGGDSQPWTL